VSRVPLPDVKPSPRLANSRRLKLVVAYDGTTFAGWQSQAGGRTIQDELENAFLKVTGQQTRVHGAGRTDAGVHALGQCAHADVVGTGLTALVFNAALNAALPPQIRVLRCRFVPHTFHARFSVLGKVYRYRIATSPVLSPFDLNRAWHIRNPLDDPSLRACADLFIGRHNFAAFAANRGHPPASSVRTIYRVRVQHTSSSTTIEFDGDGFLYKMARLMVGAIVRCALGKSTVAEVRARLRDGSPLPTRLVAPAEGLTLVRVHY
jgi:tRNA pseudouridine38-40 synthase